MKFKEHPRGLMVLFFTEMWERFSYYGMRGILTLFLIAELSSGGLGLDKPTAGAIYGLYTGLVYLLALPGGWIADRILGQRKAVFLGGLIIALGQFTLAIPMVWTFYLGLVIIIIGTGLLKPNVSTIVGDLYPEGGARRDAGFSIFYMGINLGALFGPIICGYLGENINWRLGFSAAGFGMLLGLIQYKLGEKHFGDAGNLKESAKAHKQESISMLFKGIGLVFVIIALFVLLQYTGLYQITLNGFAQFMGIFIVSIAILFFLYLFLFGNLTSTEKKRTFVIFLLFIGAALFWSGFEQAGSSMNFFAKELTDRNVMGLLIPASWLQSINPLFIIIFAPLFGSLWVWLASRKKEPSIPAKFGLGLLLLGSGFLVMMWAATYTVGGNKVSPMWLVVTYFLQTAGELCLSPVGLSSVTKLSPQRYVGQMMGIWFMGAALGNLIAGLVGGQFESLPLPELFGGVALFTGGAGLLFLLFSKPIKKLTSGVN